MYERACLEGTWSRIPVEPTGFTNDTTPSGGRDLYSFEEKSPQMSPSIALVAIAHAALIPRPV